MNAVEHIVELYYRVVKRCFTLSDIKIEGGNNRQIDLLAYDLKNNKCYHDETTVAHDERWAVTIEDNKNYIKNKFFGAPKPSRPDNPNTDFRKGKSYRSKIETAYIQHGFLPNEVIRVCCRWCSKKDSIDDGTWKLELAEEFALKPENFELLYFRDEVLKSLYNEVGTSNYADEILRTISLLKAQERQSPRSD